MKALGERRLVQQRRRRRRLHTRKRITGTLERPRLAVFRSLKHIYAQVIDDHRGVTLACAGSLEKDLRGSLKATGSVEAAKAVGTLLAQRAKEQGVTQVCFDRRHYRYHGRIAALADAAREGGLQF